MLNTFLKKHLGRFHRDEGGAVMLAALASTLMVFMLGMVLYDAGNVVRERLQNQTAADSAAYSQAALKARTMNMNSYVNVTKRSTQALHQIYTSAWLTYWGIYVSKIPKCFKWLPNISACKYLLKNFTTWFKEGTTDVRKFQGFPLSPITLNKRGEALRAYRDEYEQMQKYQDYWIELGPWFAYIEGALRAPRNGADVSSSFPPPPGLILTRVPDWANRISSFFTGSGLYNQTDEEDEVPLKKGGTFSICGHGSSPLGPILTGDLQFGLELGANFLIQRQRSSKNARDAAVVFSANLIGIGMCYYHVLLKFLDKEKAAPMLLADEIRGGAKRSAKGMMKLSNVVFSYKNDDKNQGVDNDKYKGILPDDYKETMTYVDKSNGYWTMSRGEIVTKGGSEGEYHTNWTARLRPVTFDGEFNDLGFDINAMYHDVLPYLGVQGALGLLSGVDLRTMFQDMVYFEKTSRVLKNDNHNGLFR